MMSSVDVVGKETKIVKKMDEVEEKEKKRNKSEFGWVEIKERKNEG